MTTFRYRLIDTAGGEIGIIDDERATIQVGERVQLPDGFRHPDPESNLT